jgi:hypothetical protein
MPEKQTIYHKDHGAAEMAAIDARSALQNHAAEWASKPWPKAAEAPKPAPAAADPVAPFATKAKTAGWHGIFDANGLQIGKNMREDDAKAFDAMSDEDKAEYVKAELAAS